MTHRSTGLDYSSLIDPFVPKVEEAVETSEAVIRADVLHERLVAMGFTGDERTTRRAVAVAKAAYAAGHRRSYRPWITEPGLWLQFDWGAGPVVFGPDGRPRPTMLFCAWLAWSRFRVVIPTWDRRMGTLLSCLDATFRACGGVPAFALTDNEKTVTVEHVAGVPVRHPMIVAAARHYGLTVHTCVPADPESKGGSEATVRIAKADLVPTQANLRSGYNSFAELAEACEAFCTKVNTRVHRETARIPAEAWRPSRRGCIRCRSRRSPPRPERPGWSTPTDHPVRVGALLHPTGPGRHQVWVRRRGRGAAHHRHSGGRVGRGRAAPALDPGQSEDRSGALPRPPPAAGRLTASTAATTPQPVRGSVPLPGPRRPGLVGRGCCRRHTTDAGRR